MDRVLHLQRLGSANGRKIGGVAVKKFSRTLTISIHGIVLCIDDFLCRFWLCNCSDVVRAIRRQDTDQQQYQPSKAVSTALCSDPDTRQQQ